MRFDKICDNVILEQAKILDIVCKRNKYHFSQSFKGMGFSVRLLLVKKHESGKIYPPPSPESNRVIT